MRNFFVVETLEDRELIEESIRKEVSRSDSMFRNYRITEIDVAPIDGDIRFIISSKTIRPNQFLSGEQTVKTLPIEDVVELQDEIPILRASKLPTTREDLEIEDRYPEIDVVHSRDYVIFGLNAWEFLLEYDYDDIIDLIERDVEETENHPTHSLSKGAQNNMYVASSAKLGAKEIKHRLVDRIADAFRYNFDVPVKSLRENKESVNPRKKLQKLRDGIASRRGRESNIAREKGSSLHDLEQIEQDLEEVTQRAEQESQNVIIEVVDEGGVQMPSSIKHPEEAVSRAKMGTREWLRIA